MDGKAPDAGLAVGVGERLQDGVAQPAGGPMIFGDDEVARFTRRVEHRCGVEWLGGVEIDHSGIDAELDETVGGGERLVDVGAGAEQCHVVVPGGSQRARTAVREVRMLARPWGIDPARARAPAAFWVGELDPTHPPAMSRRMAQRFGGAPVTVVPGVATFGMVSVYPHVLRHAVAMSNKLVSGPSPAR